jgi:energy-coupling factor transporter ATP-binding protein EcfA2
MTVESLRLKEFSAFKDAGFDFVPGINTLIGENATGKSHVLKVLYSALKTFEKPVDPDVPARKLLGRKLVNVFKPEDDLVRRLVRRRPGHNVGWVTVDSELGRIRFSLHTGGRAPIKLYKNEWETEAPAIFLPSREVLAISEGFTSAYEKRELSFDETYYDVCKALQASPLRGPKPLETKKILQLIEQALGGKVVRKGNRFYVRMSDGLMEAHLVAEGLRKIACVAYLASNGSLAKNGFLFWDEPEANLNPRLIRMVADLLLELASQGVQIFLATHDYLLANTLSLLSESGKTDVKMRFFALFRPKRGEAVEVTPGDLFGDLPENPILDEFAAHYDFEQELFSTTSKVGAKR